MSILLSREIRWLLKQARPYLFLQIASVGCITVGSWLYLLDPLILKWLLDRVLPNHSISGLGVALGLIFACYVGRVLLSSAGGLLTTEASQKLVLRLRMNLLRHLNRLSSDYHDVTSVGSRFYLFMEPMDEIGQLGADLIPAVLRTLVMTMSVLAAMIFVNAHLTLAIVPLVPLFLYVRHRFRMRLRAQADSVQQEQSSVSTFLQEHLAAIAQLQLLRAEKHQERHAFRRFAVALRAQFKLLRTAAGYSIASEGTTAIGMIIVLGIGGREYFRGSLTIGGLVAFYTYLTRLFEPLSGAVKLYSRLQQAGASIRKVMGAFDLRPSIVQTVHPVTLRKSTRGGLEFDQVYFAYPGGKPLLNDLSFQISPGARIGIVGTNGSGKSTTGKLVTRLYDQQSGSVRIDRVDVRDLPLSNLRDLVCLLPQNPLLFETSLLENLRFGCPDATDEEIAWAVDLAELNGVAARLDQGLRGSVGPSGNLLSGGEKQRVAIARALLQKPRILILDEATSSLDARTEERILSKVVRRLGNTTVLLISHHPSALRWMDELLLLRAGRIVERCKPALMCQNIAQFLSPADTQGPILEATPSVSKAQASD